MGGDEANPLLQMSPSTDKAVFLIDKTNVIYLTEHFLLLSAVKPHYPVTMPTDICQRGTCVLSSNLGILPCRVGLYKPSL